jgi:hypothetical protein
MKPINKQAYVDLPLKIIVDYNKSKPGKAKFTLNENKERVVVYNQYTSIDSNTNQLSIQYKSDGGYTLKTETIIKAIKYYEKKRLGI